MVGARRGGPSGRPYHRRDGLWQVERAMRRAGPLWEKVETQDVGEDLYGPAMGGPLGTGGAYIASCAMYANNQPHTWQKAPCMRHPAREDSVGAGRRPYQGTSPLLPMTRDER